ncbi:MAG: homoserine dehydrogenase [Spirochaetota bacterium]|nr:homoserine dehydrogenase [Spirochaetota bacterium]
MKKINLGLIGLGVVGSGVYSILKENKKHILLRRGIELNVKKIAVKDITKKRSIDVDKSIITSNIDDIINDTEINIVIELVGGIDFSFDLIKKSLEKNKHVITANKALLAIKGKELFGLANKNQLEIGFEASVGGGIPIIRTIKDALVGDKIKSIYGIINGTSNYILTKMVNENQDFNYALKRAQELGFAEADPTLDINGGDAAHKIAILASFAFNSIIPYDSIYCEGIDKIELNDIYYAKELGYTIKLLGIADEIMENQICVRVHPTLIPIDSPLANIKNEFNAILIDSHFLGNSMYSGKGAGMFPTANAVVSDIVEIAENIAYNIEFNEYKNIHYSKKELVPLSSKCYQYYLRFNTLDKPGILAKIAGIFGDNKISIARVIQKGKHKDSFVHLILETHDAYENDVQKAINIIDKLAIVDPPSTILRIMHPGNSN